MHTEAMTARGKVFNVRLSDDEWERVNRLAGEYGLSAASLFRLLLKQAERAFVEPGRATRQEIIQETVDRAVAKRGTYSVAVADGEDEPHRHLFDADHPKAAKPKAPKAPKARATTKGRK